ncbi:hypothetical protein B484DRAFT_322949, partial [Ochromonadaceae sp. CCMP2298]
MAEELFWGTVCPILGVVVSNMQVIPPLNAALICRKARSMGCLNATPWAMGFVNCCGWLLYGCMLGDHYIMMSVGPGVMIHYYAVTSACSLLGAQNIVLGWQCMYVALAFAIGTTLSQNYPLALMIVGGATSMVFYWAPGSKLVKILRNKDASSLYLPAILVNLLCCLLWSFYGLFGINNVYLYAPMLFGLVVTLAQLALKAVYPSHSKS